MRNYSCLLWVLLFVEGLSSDKKIEVAVTEGDHVHLPGFPGVKSDDQILWKFNSSVIVRVEERAGINSTSTDEKFKDRLKLDIKTGSLNITNIEVKHIGIYQLDIIGNGPVKTREFSVTVHDVKSKSKKKGSSFSLPFNVQEQDDQIVWKFNGQDIPTDHLNGMWSNINVNKKTGEFRFTKIQINQTGTYEVEINTSNLILHRKFSITVESVLPSAPPRSGAAGICGAGVGLLVWAVAVFLLQEV